MHTPIAWSDRRPSDEEFRCAAWQLFTSPEEKDLETVGPFLYVWARMVGWDPAQKRCRVSSEPEQVARSCLCVSRQSFASTRLSATRMLHFVEERQQCVRRLVLMNSEGYWSGELGTLHSPCTQPDNPLSSKLSWDTAV